MTLQQKLDELETVEVYNEQQTKFTLEPEHSGVMVTMKLKSGQEYAYFTSFGEAEDIIKTCTNIRHN